MSVDWEEHWDEELANEELTAELLPAPHAPFTEIAHFAGTFDGYALIGAEQLPPWSDALRTHFERHGSLPDGLDLSHLRAAVFAEERRNKWTDAYADPDADLGYVHALVGAIRAAVTGEPAPAAEPWPGVPPNRLQFAIGGHTGHSYAVELDDEPGVLRFHHHRPGHEPYEEATIRPDPEEWEPFWRRAQQLGVFAWSGAYRTVGVTDGTGWRLELDWAGRRVSASGSNAYPPDGDSPRPSGAFAGFCRAISRLCGHEIS